MQIKLLPEDERPVEKAQAKGVDKLSTSELIGLILHTGTRSKSAIGLGEDVLASLPDGLSGLGCCSMEDLLAIDGIGPAKAGRLLAAVELGKRLSASSVPKRQCIAGSDDAAELFMEELRYLKKEHFRCVLLNSKGEIIATDNVSVGELTSTVIHPREVFQAAVRKSAAAVIFVHNHPSGDPSPSGEDIKTTQRLAEAGELLGISVLDHIIIGDGSFVSLRGLGIIK